MLTARLYRFLLALSLAVLLLPTAFAEQTMTPASAADLAHLPGSNPSSCANITKVCDTCGNKPSGLTTPWQEGDKWCNLVKTSGKSSIDDLNFNYVHDAFDYLAPGAATGGCSSCGSSSAPSATGAGLFDLTMKRTHRFRNMTEHSSFGPGVFGTYDTSLRISRVNGGAWQVLVFDPDLEAPLILRDSGSGLFRGYNWNKISSLRFYAGVGGSGGVVADPSAAASAKLTAFSGVVTTFDLFNPTGTLPAPWTSGEIGNVASHGSAGTANGVFTLSAGGSDIWGTGDSFGYVYQAIQGDTTITGRVDAFTTYRGLAAEGTNNNAKAGIMLRETLDAGSVAVNLSVSHAGLEYISRTATGISAVQDGFQSGVFAPRWLRLQRVGNVITGSVSTDGSTWSVVTTKTVAMASAIYVGLSVTAHDGNGVLSDARFSSVALSGTSVPLGSMPAPVTVPYASPVLAGRLASITDRNGYAVNVTYKTWTAPQLLQSPDLPWQMDTVTDPHGRKLTVQYQAAQVAGRWAVSSLTLPTGATVTYGYGAGNDLLRSVAYSADGSASTFTYTPDSYTSSTIVHFDDAGAASTHQRKSAYLTNIFSAEIANTGAYQVYNQASNLIKMLLSNNDTEVSYLSYPQTNLVNHIYEGGGRMKEISKLTNGAMQIRYFTTWTLDPVTGFSGTPEANPLALNFGNDDAYRQDVLQQSTDENGVTKTYANDQDGFATTITYSDGTTQVYAYNTFKQVTRSKDRLNHVTVTTYDANGNETLKEVGILFNGTADVHQAEYARYQKSYYPAGDANQFLLKTTTDANGNVTTYTYTPVAADGSNHFVKTVVTPNDAGTGTITAWTFGYDSTGRQTSSQDALLRTATLTYDNRDRMIRTTYADNSTEIVVYGTGATKNMVVQRKDRQGSLTEYAYDDAGRVTAVTVGAKTMSADGLTVTPTNDGSSGPFQSLVVQATTTYLAGTDLAKNRTVNGNLTTLVYDYRLRKSTQTSYPTSSVALTTTWNYANNLLSQVTDPYGRNTYLVYRTSDARQVRQVQGLIPADTVGSTAATIARDTTTNPKYLVTDYQLDAEGQQTAITDPRNITSTATFDSRGRVTSRTEASSDSTVAGRTDYLYDAQSNQTEVRSPRYFVSADTNGYQKDRATMAYTKRNLLQSRTAALGVTGVVGTVAYTYADDGRQATSTDEDGNLATTIWKVCCARVDAQVDPQSTDTAGTFFGTRFLDYTNYGDQTHEAVTRGTTGNPAPGCCNQDPTDAQTLTEATMAYDVRHRQVARTQWFAALAAVDANNPPIAGQNGIAANLGLTTVMRYDDNLTDALGLSNPADPNSVAPYLSGLGLGTNAVGSAMVMINPAGEPRWTIMDGLGRVVRVVDGNGHATTTTYDVVDAATTLVKTTVTDALSHASSQYADAAGRVRIQEDQLLKRTALGYDADGNLVSQLDPTSVGQTCVYDARNRRTQCTDTATPPVLTYSSYDTNNNVASTTDGLGHVTTMTYDARDRKATVLDRVSGTTTFTYDAHSNLTQITDADGGITSYLYDPRELLNKETYPAGSATPNSPTTPPLDVRSYTYDAARRLQTRTDQANVVTTHVYDFISRLTAKNYSDGSGSDLYTYDAAGRVTVASSVFYRLGVSRSYTIGGEKAGNLRSESQSIGGVSWTVGYAYDAANRVTSVTYPDGSVVARTYSNRNQLSTVKLGTATIANTMVYDDAGRRTSLPLGNGLVESRSYYGDGMVHTITEGTANAVENLTYIYDANKRVTSETSGVSTNDTQGFGYDNENRVTSWTTTPTSQSWVLSKVGDWTSTARTGTGAFTQARTPWPVHEIKTIQQSPPPAGVPATAVSEDSDVKGNLSTDRFNLQYYQWDERNQLISASALASGTNVRQGDLGTYAYDAFGRRLVKAVGNLTTTYIHDGAQVVAEYESPTFISQAIGGATAGTLSFAANGVVTLTGGGADIGGTSDAFQYAYQQLAADGAVQVLVPSLSNTDPAAKAGLMLRQGTAANAPNVLLAVTPGIGVTLQSRATAGGATTTVATVAGQVAPITLRMVKSGTSVVGQYWSGVTWVTVGTATVTLTAPVEIGFAVTSHNTGSLATATFSNYAHAAPVTSAGTQTLARRYVYGAYVDEPLALLNGSGTYYYAANRVYSVVALTDSSQNVVERYRYDTYGRQTVLAADSVTTRPVSSYGQNLGFTGRYLDGETGLWYFRARYESPILGRFISRDPLDYQDGLSMYGANFIPSYLDPLGLCTSQYGLTDCRLNSSEWIDYPKIWNLVATGVSTDTSGGSDWGLLGVSFGKLRILVDFNIKWSVNCECYCRCGSQPYTYDNDEVKTPGIHFENVRVKIPLPRAPYPIPGPASLKWLYNLGSIAYSLNEMANKARPFVGPLAKIVENFGPKATCDDLVEKIRSAVEAAAARIGQ